MYHSDGLGESLASDTTVASAVAKHLGLPSSFFSRNFKSKMLRNKFYLFKIDGIIMIKIPEKFKKYLSDYKVVSLNIDEDESEFEFVIELTNKTKIGFWR